MGATMTIESPAVSGYAETFAARRDGLPGHGLPWLSELREAGMARFQERGLPSPRWEAWKYTSLRALEKIGFKGIFGPGASTLDIVEWVRKNAPAKGAASGS